MIVTIRPAKRKFHQELDLALCLSRKNLRPQAIYKVFKAVESADQVLVRGRKRRAKLFRLPG